MSDFPTLLMFLYDQEREREILSAEAVPVASARALDEFDRLSDTSGSFIGFRREDGEVLQFMWNGDGTLDIDIPVPARGGSLTRRAPVAECRVLLGPFAAGLPLSAIPGLRFESWTAT